MLHRFIQHKAQWFFLILFFIGLWWLPPPAALGQTKIWLEEAVTRDREIYIRQNSSRFIEVWVDVGTYKIEGTSFYIDYDPAFFNLTNFSPKPLVDFDPLDFESGIFGSNSIQNDLDGNHIDGSVMTTSSRSGIGKVARFEINSKNIIGTTTISIVYDRGHHRDTRYHVFGGGSNPYTQRGGITVHIFGLELRNVPDAVMIPGGRDDSIVLLDYLHNYRFKVDEMIYGATGGNNNVTASINPTTSQVTLRARGGFIGQEEIVFSVQEGVTTAYDTIIVAVTYPPEIVGIPDTIKFAEDEHYASPPFSEIATDQDDETSSIGLSGNVVDGPLTLEFSIPDSKFYITSEYNYYGPGKISLKAIDPHGAEGYRDVPVLVTAVNDPPLITPIEDLIIPPDRLYNSLILNMYVSDVDNSVEEMTWTASGGTRIGITLLPEDNYRVELLPDNGFIGSEDIIFRVQDPEGAFDVDTVNISVQKLAPKIQKLPDASLCSSDSLTHNYIDLDDYVVDLDNPISSLEWTITGDSLITTLYDPFTHVVRFRLQTPGQRGWEQRIFTARDPDGNVSRDTIFVVAVSRGYPTIRAFPKIILPSGATDNSVVLDDYVYLCDEGDKNLLSWEVIGKKNLTVSIDSDTRRVSITAPGDFFGPETLTFRGTAPGGGADEGDMIVEVVPGGSAPYLTPFNPVVLSKRKQVAEVNLMEHLLIYPDSLRYYIGWGIGGSHPAIKFTVDQLMNTVTFTLQSDDYIGEIPYVLTARNLQNNASVQRELLVIVSEGKGPILGSIPDVSFLSGEGDASVDLDFYVRDEDTPDSKMTWSVSGNSGVSVNTSRLQIGADHVLELGNVQGFVGTETLVLTVEDPEGNFAKDTIYVSVRFISDYNISIIPNAVVGEFIDIIVNSLDSLSEGPMVEVAFNNEKNYIPVSKIPGVYIWKSDYVFPVKSQGTATIISTAINWFGRVLIDTAFVTVGSISKTASLILAHQEATVTLPKQSVPNQKTVVLVPEDVKDITYRIHFDSEDIPPPKFIKGFWLGPMEMELSKPGKLQLHIPFLPHELSDWDKAGLYSGDYGEDDPEFLSRVSNDGMAECDLTHFGYYYIAEDRDPPVISIVDYYRSEEGIVFSLDVTESGSGITAHGMHAFLGNEKINGIYDPDSRELLIPAAEFPDESGPMIITIAAVDRVGNESERVEVLLEEGDIGKPTEFILYQNYPNPFNPVTTIRYKIPNAGSVLLRIFNLMGQEVATLIDSEQRGGMHEVQWDGCNSFGIRVSSGVYIYRLETVSFQKSRKMILLK